MIKTVVVPDIHTYETFDLEKLIKAMPESQRPYLITLFSPDALEGYLTRDERIEISAKIFENEPYIKDVSVNFGVFLDWDLWRIEGTPEEHAHLLQLWVKEVIKKHENIGADDGYYDYYPNTVLTLYFYAVSLSRVDLLKPLTSLLYSQESRYWDTTNYDNPADCVDEHFDYLKTLVAPKS